jgi:hypothetical protein
MKSLRSMLFVVLIALRRCFFPDRRAKVGGAKVFRQSEKSCGFLGGPPDDFPAGRHQNRADACNAAGDFHGYRASA